MRGKMLSTQNCDVSIVIVSFNTKMITIDCLKSIYELTVGCSYEVIVIDNNSHDGSVELIKRTFPQTIVVENRINRGFAAANNQGLKIAKGKYILLLNPDTKVYRDTLVNTFKFADSYQSAGIIGCRVFGRDGEQQSTIFKDKSISDVIINLFMPNRIMRKYKTFGKSRYVGIDLEQTHCVDVVAGCFMFTRREVYEQIGGMDEDFFMYGEESEWCYRVRQNGWKIVYYPKARIMHYGGLSTGSLPSEMNIAMTISHILLLEKTKGKRLAYVASILMLLRDLPRVALLWPILKIGKIRSPQNLQLKKFSHRLKIYFDYALRKNA